MKCCLHTCYVRNRGSAASEIEACRYAVLDDVMRAVCGILNADHARMYFGKGRDVDPVLQQ